jgi:hypothetical protein
MSATVDVPHGRPMMIRSYLFERRSQYEPMSRPILGLPLKRVVPMEVHALLDYANAGTTAATAIIADRPEARTAGVVLSALVGGISLVTDYDLSLKKWVPIEVHEVADYLWGFSAVAAPFLLGYFKKNRVASAMQIFAGVTTILGSLFTDYRSATGKTLAGHPRSV